MRFLANLHADWMTWLLVPVFVLAGLRGPLCWCDHDHGPGNEVAHGLEIDVNTSTSGHADASAHDRHSNHSSSHDGNHRHGEQVPSNHECDSSDSCECIDLQTAGDRVEEAAKPEFRKLQVFGRVKEPLARMAVPRQSGVLFLGRRSIVLRGHSPPLFVLNCRFLC